MFTGCRPGLFRVAWVAAAACLALSLAGVATASARDRVVSPRFHKLPSLSTGLVSVGERYVVYGNRYTDTAVRIVDTKTLSVRQVALPTGCTIAAPLASWHDRFMVDCDRGSAIIDSASGRVLWGPNAPDQDLDNPTSQQWAFVGDDWVRDLGRNYVNWRTGERRTASLGALIDLDNPDFGPPRFCAPFEPLNKVVSYQEDAGFAYLVQGTQANKSYYVGRCGSSGKLSKVHAIRSGGVTSGDAGSITGGWAAWTPDQRCGRSIVSYDAGKRINMRWKTTGIPKKHCFAMYKTRYAVVTYYAVDTGWDGEEQYSINRLSIAKRPH